MQSWLATNELLHFPPLVDGGIVPDHQQRPASPPEQMLQAVDDLLACDIVCMQASPQLQSLPAGCQQQRPDDIDPLAVGEARSQLRSLAARRPCPLQR